MRPAVVRAFHIVSGCHRAVVGLYGDCLRRVGRKVDYSVGNAQAVELGGASGLVAETEPAALGEFHRVELYGAFKAHVLEIQHGVFGSADAALYVELVASVACRQSCCDDCGCRCLCKMFHFHYRSMFLFLCFYQSTKLIFIFLFQQGYGLFFGT